jgi:hypothetical protein
MHYTWAVWIQGNQEGRAFLLLCLPLLSLTSFSHVVPSINGKIPKRARSIFPEQAMM